MSTALPVLNQTAVPTAVNPAPMFKSPVRAMWNIQGDQVPTLWWPSREAPSSPPKEGRSLQHTVLFMIPASHLGHTAGSHVSEPSRLYSLQEQVECKIAIMDKLFEIYPKGTRFILAGHSMGSWLALQVLKARPNHGIERLFELFPTIHHIAETPNGRKMKSLFKPVTRSILGGAVSTLRFIFSAPPVFQAIIGAFTGQDGEMSKVTSEQLLHSSVVKNCLYLAGQEMEQIKEMDISLLKEHASKFVFYYGKTDEWSPIENYYEMQELFPEIKSFLCDQGMVHAFVLGHGEAMGLKVGAWINEL
ncbi:hypothetical protein BGW38_000812 [Lunasporangiospora selenospora]|uniref:Uncharacterized protein n=1 Tax=Lunasporangiospora selenospora TaxID=979761 RepID=A0A9P6FUR9_9FUNG|nr:hypothetical protein BGW38_000812 [Lunasporangiospora selenospora]